MGAILSTERATKVHDMLFRHATEGLVVVDGSGSMVMLNPRLGTLFGYDPKELEGRPVEFLLPVPLREGHQRSRRASQEAPMDRPMGTGMDLVGRRKDGSTFPVEVSLNHFEVEGDRYVVALVTDITERRKAQDEIIRSNADLEERVESRTAELRTAEAELRRALDAERELNTLRSRFVSMASHEFRTPLSTIMGSVDLITRYNEGPQQEQIGKHLARIRTKVKELVSTINEFLSLEKLEHGSVTIEAEEFDVVHLCVELLEEMRSLARNGQRISYEHIGEARVLVQDRKMFVHVITNLLTNAIKYSPENRSIRLSTSIQDRNCTITVEDEGIGIPEEEQQRLFQRFFRASNARNEQGTGLGLTIVQRYVELLGGNINFRSMTGAGTTFLANFPRFHPNAARSDKGGAMERAQH